jgi:hypothetical protein
MVTLEVNRIAPLSSAPGGGRRDGADAARRVLQRASMEQLES